MSHDRRNYYSRDRERNREWERSDYRGRESEKRRSRSPRKNEKDSVDDNILRELSKLPEPSDLWESNSFPVSFQGEGNQGFRLNYQPSYSGIYDDFPSSGPVPVPHGASDSNQWNQMSLPPQAPPAPTINREDMIKKEAAIASEMRHQKAALSKQREDYIKKASVLRKELDTLKDQRNELRGDSKRSPSPDTKKFLKENTKLQLEIQNKLKTITNVVDMLNGIIGEEVRMDLNDSDNSPDRSTKKKSKSPSGKKFNYVYYDPEMHWCRVCNEFPETAKSYLNHLHSPSHQKMAAAHMEAPWHSITGMNEGFPNYPNAPNKRTPIRGLQFFVPSTAWYCKLCDQFIGDLHCASAHLKSVSHSKNYINFVEQNPHWETDWMSDRQKAFEKCRTNKQKVEIHEEKSQYASHTITFNKDGFHTKRKGSRSPEQEKKKKDKKKKSKRKRSSSSSSSASSSVSERVKKKKSKSKKDKSQDKEASEKALAVWMSHIQMDKLNDYDRNLLDTLKSKIKSENSQEEKRRKSKSRDRDQSASDVKRRPREKEHRDKDRYIDSRREDKNAERRVERRSKRDDGSTSRNETKKDFKKMPFIGKMPLFKHLGKNPKEEHKKEEEKKKEVDGEKKKVENEFNKKKKEEIDAEIQKKVAEFKEKIAKSQEEKQQQHQQVELMPNILPLPTPVQFMQHHPQVLTQPQQPNLSKDFQDALDIIFPSADGNKADIGQEVFAGMPGYPLVPNFPPMGMMQPQMFPFEMNTQMFQPQLYDHIQGVSGQSMPTPQPNTQVRRKNLSKNGQKMRNLSVPTTNINPDAPANTSSNVCNMETVSEKKREELDELAMLGIDASDVGAGSLNA